MSRSLSALGAKLILHLEWEEQPVVRIEEAMDILDCSYARARQVIHRLVRDRWLAPITRGKEYRLVRQAPHSFFGALEVDAYGTPVMMATPEKTIADCLDPPAYAGELPEIAGMLWRGKGHLDWELLADYALRFKSYSLVQRLGYLVNVLEIPLSTESRDRILSRARWGTGGQYHGTWRIVDNVLREELLAEIEVR